MWLHTCARPPPLDGRWRSLTHPSPAALCWPSLDRRTPQPARQHLLYTRWRYSRCTRLSSCRLWMRLDTTPSKCWTFKVLRSTTDLGLRATKTTAQVIGRSTASLAVIECHLWLNLTEIKDMDKAVFFDSPISFSGLFGPAVDGFAERSTAAQKSSQAIRHFLPKRSCSSVSSRPKPAPTQQPPKDTPSATQPVPRSEHRHALSCSAKRHPPLK